MKVQHDFVIDGSPEEFADLTLEAEGLRDYGVVFDPDNPSNASLITIWDDLDAARRAAESTDLIQKAVGGRAKPAGAGSLQISPQGKGSRGTETGRQTSY